MRLRRQLISHSFSACLTLCRVFKWCRHNRPCGSRKVDSCEGHLRRTGTNVSGLYETICPHISNLHTFFAFSAFCLKMRSFSLQDWNLVTQILNINSNSVFFMTWKMFSRNFEWSLTIVFMPHKEEATYSVFCKVLYVEMSKSFVLGARDSSKFCSSRFQRHPQKSHQ